MEIKGIGYKELERYGVVYVSRVKRTEEYAWDVCDCCGKDLAKTFYSVQDKEGYEAYLGAGCYNKLKK